MTEQTERLIAEALQLSAEERAVLIDALLGSESPADIEHDLTESPDDIQAAWEAELQRRLEDVKTGRVQCAPLDEAWRRITGKHA